MRRIDEVIAQRRRPGPASSKPCLSLHGDERRNRVRSGLALEEGRLELLVPPRRGHSSLASFGFLACGGAGPEGAELPGRTDFRIRPSAGMRILPCA